MKTNILIVTLLLVCVAIVNAEELTGEQIMKKANDVLNQDQSRGIFELTINTSSGQQRTFVYESFSKNKGEKNLIRYLEPSRVKNQATLMLNNADDIWTYFPRTKRVRKLATHAKKQKMEGSDFAYEDMGGGDSFLTDFTKERMEDEEVDGKDCFVVDLKPRPDVVSSYSHMVIYIDKETYLMIAADYFDEDDPVNISKKLTIKDIQTIQGVPTPMHMEMHSLLDNTKTVMKMREVDYNVNLPDEMFTERGLRK